jgi:hypothetical protein
MIKHALAHPADNEAMRLVALLLIDLSLALRLMIELTEAQRTGSPGRVRRLKRRLDQVLRALAQATNT